MGVSKQRAQGYFWLALVCLTLSACISGPSQQNAAGPLPYADVKKNMKANIGKRAVWVGKEMESKTIRDAQGKIVQCGRREDRMGGYELLPGKNIIEIRATDRKGREYYASYVMILGDKTAVIEKPDVSTDKAEVFRGRKARTSHR